MSERYGYLGPEATFTEAALIALMEARGTAYAARVPMKNVDAALAAVAAGEIDGAVVPIENSVEGGVPATLDALSAHGRLQIVAETLVPITMVLAVKPGTTLADVRAFSSHPHGEAQVRGWIDDHLPNAVYRPASSTAAAARDRAHGTDAAGAPVDHQAAVCPRLAAERYGLEILAEDIGDRQDAVTRFVLVRLPGRLPRSTGADKTTIVAALASDRAGALLEMLEQFSTRGINLSRIESRPTGDGLGLYQFSIDLTGHIHEARMAEALTGVHRVTRSLQFLGSYPSADEVETTVAPENTDAAFADASAWLQRILTTGK
ncbi:prephenate dehydratase [Brevibacterium samyangense]|uniref:Prephenate dehydratase n=1 Tax=Brevibacterium samyangense TaxID=366888 RepID=A0ABN2TBL1_9MICO